LPLPADIYGPARRNSAGLNMSSETELSALAQALGAVQNGWDKSSGETFRSIVAVDGEQRGTARPINDPSDRRRSLGSWLPLPVAMVGDVMRVASTAQTGWDAQPAETRAQMLERTAALLEANRPELLALLVREAGKTLPDAIAEVREAEDFLRYYAMHARRLLARPEILPGPTGEHNELQLHGRGVFVCISPWNFPLAIFAGQIAAALVAGNCVIAKPAEQTNRIGLRFVQLMHDAGVPKQVLQCVLGDGEVGAALVADPRVAGVAFTGSVSVAQAINRTLAARPGPIATLIAETGGQNAMIVDSSALPEQVVKDTIHSAFMSAGQRCSALRLLCLQQDIADKTIGMLRGAMRELVIGNPGFTSTDIGPVIDEEARSRLERHASELAAAGRVIERLPLPESCANGSFVAPMVAEIGGINELKEEHFGPLLHVVRFAESRLDELVAQINATGFGLTLGVHSRIETTWRRVQANAHVGNVYINRGMTGAVVGVQPFGGEGYSGTGPKAGGPHYLLRFVTERTLTVNTAAVGGNARLLAQSG
jgi:RHH-type proline utilization regulon transcriptional repressor/proline dehydrogenase/delta 1-pyrroline-5-carboxylate dehydrogenase